MGDTANEALDKYAEAVQPIPKVCPSLKEAIYAERGYLRRCHEHLMKTSTPARKTILFVGPASPVFKTRLWMLQRAGYTVVTCATPGEAAQHLASGEFNLVILGSSLESEEAARVAEQAKAISKRLPVLSFAPTGSLHVDVRLGSLEKPDLLLKAAGELIMRNHQHPELKSKLVAYSDAERHLIHVSDGVCKLLDYHREELIGMRIDDISESPSRAVAQKFKDYMRDGGQSGPYVLKKRTGEKVIIRYKAQVLEDGCMVSEWELAA